MSRDCRKILKNLPSNLYTNDDVDRAIKDLEEAVKTPNAAEKLEQIKDKINKDTGEKVNRRKRIKYHTLINVANTLNHIKQFNEPVRGLNSYMVGVFAKAKDSGASVDAAGKTRTALFQTRLTRELKAKKYSDGTSLFMFIKDPKNLLDVAKALFKEEDAPNSRSKDCAKIIKKIYKDQVEMLNARGANIKELTNFIASQVHNKTEMMKTAKSWSDRRAILKDAFKKYGVRDIASVKKYLAEIAYNRWKNFVLPRADLEKTFGDETSEAGREKILRTIYNNILQGKSLDEDEVFSGRPNMQTLTDRHRMVHFKDAESYAEYSKEYGHGDIAQSVLKTIDKNSKNIAILEKMGPDPDKWYDLVKSEIKKISPNDPKIEQKLASSEKYYKTVLDRDQIPVNHLWANIGGATRNILAMGKLGGVVLKSLPDLVQDLSTMRSSGVGLLDRYHTAFTQLGILFKKQEMEFLMDSLGVMNVMGHFNTRFIADDTDVGMLSKWMSRYFKWTGQQHWDTSIRLGVASALSRNLANLRNVEFDKLPTSLKRTVNRYGWEQRDWDLIRSNPDAMKNFKGKMYVTPDMVDQFSDESLANYMDKKSLSARDRTKALDEIQFKLQQYFTEETDTAQLTPGAADRAMLIRGHQRGTFEGEVLRFATQFKQYSLNITRRGIGRLLLQESNDPFMQSVIKGNLSTDGILEYMVTAAIMGYMSTAASSFVKNGSIPDPSKFTTWGDSMVNGGGLGMYGDYIFHNYNQYGGGILPMVAGPAAGAVSDLTKLMSTLATVDNKGHNLSYHDRVLKNLTMMGKNYIPFGNLFYAKWAIDYLLNHKVLNAVDPSYLSRHQAAVRKQNQDNIPLF